MKKGSLQLAESRMIRKKKYPLTYLNSDLKFQWAFTALKIFRF